MSNVHIFSLGTLVSIHLKWRGIIFQRPEAFLSGTSSNVFTVNIPLTLHWIQFRKRDGQSCDTLNSDSKQARCPLLCLIDYNWLMAIEWSWGPLENYLASARTELFNQEGNTETQHIPLQASTNTLRINNKSSEWRWWDWLYLRRCET